MARTQVPAIQIARIIGVRFQTLNEICKSEHGVTIGDFLYRFKYAGTADILDWQFQSAKRGNSNMLRWLGLNYCQQSAKVVVYHKNHPGGENAPEQPAIPTGFAIEGYDEAELAEIDRKEAEEARQQFEKEMTIDAEGGTVEGDNSGKTS